MAELEIEFKQFSSRIHAVNHWGIWSIKYREHVMRYDQMWSSFKNSFWGDGHKPETGRMSLSIRKSVPDSIRKVCAKYWREPEIRWSLGGP